MWYNNNMKTRFIFFLLAFLGVASLGMFDNNALIADEIADTICYVSFGDSIAVGYNLPNYSADISDASDDTFGKFVEDSYSYKFKTMLENKFGTNNVVSTTYAQSGDASKELINKLNSTTVQNTLKSADIVTICIGANDILGPALNNISGYVLKDSVSGSVTVSEMENQLSDGLENFKGKDGAEGNFDKILNMLYAINPDATYIFTNVYNPYKVFALPTSLSSFIAYTDFSEQKINQMGAITEVYLAGGTNTQGQSIQGLNQILESKINAFGHDNFALVDSHASFDLYTQSTTPKYNELVYATLTKDSNVNISELMSGGIDVIMQKADPHPTELGHGLLFNEFKNYFDNNICTLTLDYNGETINGKSGEIKLCNKHASPTLPSLESDKVFAGWYTLSGDKWTENNQITSDMVLYAKWMYAITYNLYGGINNSENPTCYTSEDNITLKNAEKTGYLFDGWYTEAQYVNRKQQIQVGESGNLNLHAKWTPIDYTITYELDGGTNNSENPTCYTIENSEIILKNPTKQGANFVGWYTDSEYKNHVTKIQNGSVGDLTLYAKWTQSWVVTFDSNGGTDCQPIGVEDGLKIANEPQPIRTDCDDNIFAGWYYNNQLWDFENNVVTSNITLVAKWVGLVCNTSQNLQQKINQTKTVDFSVDLQNAQFSWYVNDGLQTEQTNNTFSYTPNAVGTYTIYCFANGVKSKQYTISVEFLVPDKITLNSQKKDDGDYLFSVKNGEYYNPDKIVWYKITNINSSDVEIIGTGISCSKKITSNCYVYAVYDNIIMSEKIEVKIAEINKHSDNGILIVIIITVSVVIITLAVIIIIKRKSIKKA